MDRMAVTIVVTIRMANSAWFPFQRRSIPAFSTRLANCWTASCYMFMVALWWIGQARPLVKMPIGYQFIREPWFDEKSSLA